MDHRRRCIALIASRDAYAWSGWRDQDVSTTPPSTAKRSSVPVWVKSRIPNSVREAHDMCETLWHLGAHVRRHLQPHVRQRRVRPRADGEPGLRRGAPTGDQRRGEKAPITDLKQTPPPAGACDVSSHRKGGDSPLGPE